MLTEEEAVALTLGLLAVRRTNLALYAPAVEGALAKIERVLPVSLRRRVQAVQEAVVLHLAPPRKVPAREAVITLSTAILEQRQVALRHRSAQGVETERPFDPYGLVYRAGRWYVVGYCHLRAAQRVFRLDRVQQATLQDEPCTRLAEFDPLAGSGACTARLLRRPTYGITQRQCDPLEALKHHMEADQAIPRVVERLRNGGEDLEAERLP